MFKFKSKNKNKVDKKAATQQLILTEQNNQNEPMRTTNDKNLKNDKNNKQGRIFVFICFFLTSN